jgi:hypothetical protein
MLDSALEYFFASAPQTAFPRLHFLGHPASSVRIFFISVCSFSTSAKSDQYCTASLDLSISFDVVSQVFLIPLGPVLESTPEAPPSPPSDAQVIIASKVDSSLPIVLVA